MGGWHKKGNGFRHLGQYQQASNCFEKAIEIDPSIGVVE
jgi:tetratricopeptide (TPR) repeat protein